MRRAIDWSMWAVTCLLRSFLFWPQPVSNAVSSLTHIYMSVVGYCIKCSIHTFHIFILWMMIVEAKNDINYTTFFFFPSSLSNALFFYHSILLFWLHPSSVRIRVTGIHTQTVVLRQALRVQRARVLNLFFAFISSSVNYVTFYFYMIYFVFIFIRLFIVFITEPRFNFTLPSFDWLMCHFNYFR